MRLLILLVGACMALGAVPDEKKIVCYFGSWAVYRPGAGKFSIEDIDPRICTHLIYGFVGLSGNDIAVLDAWQDLPDNWGKDGFGRFNALRNQSPGTKTLVAIGGWNEGSLKYSAMAANAKSRSEFIKNAVKFVKKWNFDGFDLDWEYPAQRGGSPEDVKNFVALVKEMRAVFDEEGLLLSAAVGAAESTASLSYNIAEIAKHLHFINLMAYDLHGPWEPQTGLNAPLYSGSSDTGLSKDLSVDAAVNYWLSQGAPPEKLILGVPAYGRTFALANSNAAQIGDATKGPGAAGPYTRESGMLGYNEICELHSSQPWKVAFDEERRVPYAHYGNQWVGYDDVKSIKEKAEYAKKMGLGGAMVWSIETDDFRGKCGTKYPLIKTLNKVLRGTGAEVGDEVPTESVSQTVSPVVPSSSSSPQEPDVSENEINETGKCSAAGSMPDSENCEQFFQCVPLPNGQFAKMIQRCPPGLCFKAKSGICDWK